MSDEKIILESSPEAAERVTVTVWRSRTGKMWPDTPEGERAARYNGSTHVTCKCGSVRERYWIACEQCRSRAREGRLANYPREEWDGSFPIYSEAFSKYILDDCQFDEILDGSYDGVVRTFEDLIPLKCEPNRVRELDSDYCADDLPDEDCGEPPTELQNAMDAFNAATKDIILSWSPMDVVLTWGRRGKLDNDQTNT